MCESVLRTGSRLGLLVGLLVHQWVSNGFGVPDTGLGPGTPWWSNRQSLRSHGACNLEGSGQPVSVCRTPPRLAGSPFLLCAASPPYRRAYCPEQTPELSQSNLMTWDSLYARVCSHVRRKYLPASSPCKASEGISEVFGKGQDTGGGRQAVPGKGTTFASPFLVTYCLLKLSSWRGCPFPSSPVI